MDIVLYNVVLFAMGLIVLSLYGLARVVDARQRRQYADDPRQLAALDTARDNWVIGWNFYLPDYAVLMFCGAAVAIVREGLPGLTYVLGGGLAVLLHFLLLRRAYARLVPWLFWLVGLAALTLILALSFIRE